MSRKYYSQANATVILSLTSHELQTAKPSAVALYSRCNASGKVSRHWIYNIYRYRTDVTCFHALPFFFFLLTRAYTNFFVMFCSSFLPIYGIYKNYQKIFLSERLYCYRITGLIDQLVQWHFIAFFFFALIISCWICTFLFTRWNI